MAITVLLIFALSIIFLIIKFLKHYRVLKILSEIPGLSFTSSVVMILNILKKPRSRLSAEFFQYMLGTTTLMRKEGICRLSPSPFTTPFILLFSAETLEPIMTSSTLIEKGPAYKIVKILFRDSVLTGSKDVWRTRRRLISPFFHYRMLLHFIKVFDRHSKMIVKKLHENNEDSINILTLTNQCTLGVMMETAIGSKLNGEWILGYLSATKSVLRSLNERLVKPWLYNDFIWSFTNTGRTITKNIEVLFEGLRKVIKDKQDEIREENKEAKTIYDPEEEKKSKTLVDILVNHQLLHEPYETLNDDEIAVELNQIVAAGNDSTSKSIGWTLYHIGRLPEIQWKVFEEQLQIFGDNKERTTTWNDLQSMNYLDRVIKESLRLCPSFPYTTRHITEDVNIKGYKIPRNSTVICLIHALHRDPKVFPEPEVFDPDRFLPEKCREMHPFAYIPFSAGIRNCIGQKFATFEIKNVISNIIRNFELQSVDAYDRISLEGNVSLKPIGGLNLKFTKREY